MDGRRGLSRPSISVIPRSAATRDPSLRLPGALASERGIPRCARNDRGARIASWTVGGGCPALPFLSSRGAQRRGIPLFDSPALSPPREGFLAALGMTGAHASHHGWSEEVVPPFHFCHPEE